MKKVKYSSEELKILDYVEKKNPKSISNIKGRIKTLKQSAQTKIAKRVPINLRVLEDDLKKIKMEANIEGIPYQTLISSILHKYLNGNLVAKRG